jgi:O-Antigen ligase
MTNEGRRRIEDAPGSGDRGGLKIRMKKIGMKWSSLKRFMHWSALKTLFGERLRPIVIAYALAAFAALNNISRQALRLWRKPRFKSKVFRTIAFAIFIMLYGLIVGFAAALFPPMASISMIAVLLPLLLWALPDVPTFPEKALRRAFITVVIVYLCVPNYYMVQIPGLPWLSVRRIVALVLILLTLYTIATSKSQRGVVGGYLSAEPLLKLFVVGFFFMASVSLLTSKDPAYSLSRLTEVTLNWYVPFFACLLVIRSETQIAALYKTIALLSLFAAAIGLADFIGQSNHAIKLIPEAMLSAMAASNPSIDVMIHSNPFRNGQYRASSIFGTALSFGEFGAMVGPLGGYFIFHARTSWERLLGFAVIAGALVTLFVSGSRGGSLGFLIAMPLLIGLWTIRFTRQNPFSMAGPLAIALTGVGSAAMTALVLLWPKLRNIVIGGGDAASSTDSRFQQATLALVQIKLNPFTGHGLGLGGATIGWFSPGGQASIDSYLLAIVVETGIPGALCFFGMIVVAGVVMAKVYLTDDDPAAAVAGPLACTFLAYGVYRLFLAELDNQTLFFILLAMTFNVAQASSRRLAEKRRPELKSGTRQFASSVS